MQQLNTDSESLQHQRHLVVAGDGNVHIAERRVSVAQGDGGDVDVGGLRQWLVVGTGIGDNQEAGLPEGRLDLIGEGPGGEAAVERCGAGSRSELQHSSLKRKKLGEHKRQLQTSDIILIYEVEIAS